MAATVAGIHLGPDTHANRPAAATPPVGSLYSCTDHSLVYRTSGSAWSTYASAITSSGSVATDTIWDAKGDLAGGTGADTASKLTAGADQTMLIADSSQTTGLRWIALANGRVVRTTGDFTHTGDTSFTDVTGASITITTGARRVLLQFTGSWYSNNASATAAATFVVDGTAVGGSTAGLTTYNQTATTSEAVPISMHHLTDVLSAGSHTFKVQAKVFNAAHTVTVQGADPAYEFTAIELPIGA